MAKINMNECSNDGLSSKKIKDSKSGESIFNLISSGIQQVKELSGIFNTVNSSINSRKKTDTDNAVQICKAETETQKETNRHFEQMERIKQEWEKISTDSEAKAQKRDLMKNLIERLQTEYDRYLEMDEKIFMLDSVSSRLERLHKTIEALIKELNKI